MVVSTAIIFVLFPRLSTELGVEQYGVWLVLNSAVAYFGLLMLGVPLSTVRFITKYQAENDPARVRSVINTAMLVYVGMSFVVLVAGGILALTIHRFVAVTPETLTRARWAVGVLTLSCAGTFPFYVFESILHAYQRFAVLSTIRVFASGLRFALTLLLVNKDNGLPVLAGLVALASLVQFLSYYAYIKVALPGLEFRPWKAERSVLRIITGYSLAVLIFAFASRLSFGTDSIVIAKVISAPAVVEYAVGANFFVYLTTLMTGVAQVLMPQMSLAYSSGRDKTALKETLVRYSQGAAYLSILACGGLLALGSEFIEIWMGKHFAEVSYPITVILLFAYLPFLVQRATAYPVLMATSRMNAIAIMTGVAAVANLAMSVVLARWMGIAGVAWGTSVPTLVSVVAVMWYLAKVLEMRIGEYLRSSFLVPLATAPALLVIAYSLKRLVGCSSLGRLAVVGALTVVLYGGLAALLFVRSARAPLGSRSASSAEVN
jgi:O-antigen/teichoic acid export membrane protein